jgi:uncharacterized protein
MAERLTRRSEVAADVTDLFAWHARPGAFRRLTPPWDATSVVERTGGDIEVGGTVVLRTPAGPLRGRLAPRWVAQHVESEPPYRFRDVQRSGPFAAWDHTHRFHSLGPGRSVLEDDVVYRLPLGRLGKALAGGVVRRRLDRIFDYRHRVTVADVEAHRAAGAAPLRIAVAGATGFLGGVLVPLLTSGGHDVVVLTRGAPGPGRVHWDPARGELDPDVVEDVDVVIHLADEPGAAGRWTEAHKRRVRDSRTQGTTLVAEALAKRAQDGRPRALVTASGINYYGDRGDAELSEDDGRGDGFLADVVRAREAATGPAREAGVRVVNVRIGIVLSPAGGALARQLPLFRLGLGGRFGSGRQWMSWIAVDDVAGVLHHAAVTPDMSGPFNATAPRPVTNAEFGRVLGRVLRRPALLPLPRFGARLLFGEMADGLLFTSARVLPVRTLAAGYRFRHPSLEGALRHVLGRRGAA